MAKYTYVKFEENNQWEGETWYTWLQLEGNEKELQKLQAALRTEDQETYILDLKRKITESEFNKLRKSCGTAYMDEHGMALGTFKMPKVKNFEELHRKLYKGGIYDFFKRPEK